MEKNVSPKLGDMISAKKLGMKSLGNLTWTACDICGKERWLFINKRRGTTTCKSCANRKKCTGKIGRFHVAWKGGRYKTSAGYMNIRVFPDDPFFSMADRSDCVREHRLVMAKHIGRCLLQKEVVHHLNGKKLDNRIENLSLTNNQKHQEIIANFQERIKSLEKIVKNQEVRIKKLEINAINWG